MPIRWRTRQYERTCDDCGHTWRVPRQFAKHLKPLRLRPMASGRGPLGPDAADALIRQGGTPYADAADIQAYDERAEEFEAYRTCPKCSSQHYSQRPIRS